MVKNRNLTLDVAKGISIVLMTLSHFPFIKDYPTLDYLNAYYLVSFKMPLFFFVSGYLLSTRYSYLKFLTIKFDALVKTALGAVFVLCILVFAVSKQWIVFEKFGESMLDGTFIPEGIGAGPLWFVFSLFLSLALCRGMIDLSSMISSWLRYVLWISFLIVLILLYLNHVRFFYLDTLVFSSVFVMLGYLFRMKVCISKLSSFFENYRYLVSSIVVFIFFLLLANWYKVYLNIGDPTGPKVIGNPVLSILKAISGIYIVLFLCDYLQRFGTFSRILVACSKASFIILAYHKVVCEVLIRIFSKFSLPKPLENGVEFVFTIVVCWGIFRMFSQFTITEKIFLPNPKLKKM